MWAVVQWSPMSCGGFHWQLSWAPTGDRWLPLIHSVKYCHSLSFSRISRPGQILSMRLVLSPFYGLKLQFTVENDLGIFFWVGQQPLEEGKTRRTAPCIRSHSSPSHRDSITRAVHIQHVHSTPKLQRIFMHGRLGLRDSYLR